MLDDWEVLRELILKPPPHQDVLTSSSFHYEWEGFRVMRELILKPPLHQEVLTF